MDSRIQVPEPEYAEIKACYREQMKSPDASYKDNNYSRVDNLYREAAPTRNPAASLAADRQDGRQRLRGNRLIEQNESICGCRAVRLPHKNRWPNPDTFPWNLAVERILSEKRQVRGGFPVPSGSVDDLEGAS